MAKGINKCIFIGNVCKDPETRSLPSGGNVCSIALACSETWNDKQTGEKKEKTEWVPIVFFNGLADVAAKFVKKGQQIYVEGAFKTRKWQDQEGKDRYTTEIVAHDLQLLGSRPNGQQASQGNQQQAPARSQAPQQRQQAPQQRQAAPAMAGDGFGDGGFEDDDIPF